MAAVRPVRAGPCDLLFHHPAADEAEAAEGAGVSRQPQGGRPGDHDRRHLRSGHARRRSERAAPDCRQDPHRRGEGARSAAIRAGARCRALQRVVRSCRSYAGKSSPSSRSCWYSARSALSRLSRRGSASPAPEWLRDKELKLGLDLKGGVHLVLRVQTDDALQARDANGDGAAARAAAARTPSTVGDLASGSTRPSSRSRASRHAQDAAFRKSAAEVEANFDRELRRRTASTPSR